MVSTDTPLLDAPLTGPAYAVSGFGQLPHVAFILAGQVTVTPEAESSSVNGGHLRTVVPIIPDVPIGHFRLNLFGGKQGYLINTRSLCSSASKVRVEYSAENGADLSKSIGLKTACPKKTKHPKRGTAHSPVGGPPQSSGSRRYFPLYLASCFVLLHKHRKIRG